jgi:hypothetical protein
VPSAASGRVSEAEYETFTQDRAPSSTSTSLGPTCAPGVRPSASPAANPEPAPGHRAGSARETSLRSPGGAIHRRRLLVAPATWGESGHKPCHCADVAPDPPADETPPRGRRPARSKGCRALAPRRRALNPRRRALKPRRRQDKPRCRQACCSPGELADRLKPFIRKVEALTRSEIFLRDWRSPQSRRNQ